MKFVPRSFGVLLLFGMAGLFGFSATDASAQLLKRNRTKAAPAVVVPAAPATEAQSAAPLEAGGISEAHALLYETARARAVGQLARKKNISRAAAREMIDDAAPDELLHKLAKKNGINVKSLPTAGGLSGFLDWLIAHSDQIMALVKIIMALFGVDAEVALPIALAAAWDYYWDLVA